MAIAARRAAVANGLRRPGRRLQAGQPAGRDVGLQIGGADADRDGGAVHPSRGGGDDHRVLVGLIT